MIRNATDTPRGHSPRELLGRILSVTLLLAAAGCGRTMGESGSGSPPAPQTLRVEVTKPERGSIVRQATLPGSVRAEQQVVLNAKTPGYIKGIVKDRGDSVEEGELIATLDIPEMNLDLESAEATAQLEEATLARLEGIRKIEKTAVTDLDIDVEKAKHAVAAAAVKRWKTMMQYAEIRAPFKGKVTQRWVDKGTYVQTGSIVEVMDLTKIRVIVDVPEAEARHVANGLHGTVRLEALPGKSFDAVVARFTTALDTSTRMMHTELTILKPEDAILPGMYAQVALDLERHEDVLTLPSKAVLSEQGKPIVFVAADGAARKTSIQIGLTDGAHVEVSGGLEGSESVILPGKEALTDGLKVVPAPSK